jgi:hypothetical protein
MLKMDEIARLEKIRGKYEINRCNENTIYVTLFWELRGLGPNFHIHVSIPMGSVNIFLAAE